MISRMRKQNVPFEVLALALDGSRLEGAVVRRSNGSLQVKKGFTVSLALNPLTDDPQLVGREIRNHLDQAGVSQRRCIVALPASWVLSLQTKLPDLPDADIGSFLEIEAERGFPYSPDLLSTTSSQCEAGDGARYVTLLAIPRNHLLQLEKALRLAQLRPLSFMPAMAALQNPQDEASDGTVALAVGENSLGLQITCGGGLVAFRALEEAAHADASQKEIDADQLARELRITLGQLPTEVRERLRKVRLFGRGEAVRRLAATLGSQLTPPGLPVEIVQAYAPNEFSKRLPPEVPVSAAVSLAARFLTGAKPPFEFLPPKVSSWQQFAVKVSSRKFATAGAAAAAILFLIAATFLYQHWRLSRLKATWATMEPKVAELDAMQQQIKRFRPWFDDSFPSLSILRSVTTAFPEAGVVSAKTIEVRTPATVTCTGIANDNQAFLKMLDQLRADRQVNDLKVDQVRGKTPMQFTFNFQWREGAAREN